ncbi:MAG: IS3 family transposase [Cytophagaceae bacterium]|nr:IS3 family transposase [Cytophagaceae bacterium]
MKQKRPELTMSVICGLFGKSRQGWYDKKQYKNKKNIEEETIISSVETIRKDMPRIGGLKLYKLLNNSERIIGRDKLFNLLKYKGMLVYRKKRFEKTTDSKHWMRKYPNLIKDIKVSRPDEIWVSDITYIPTEQGHSYLSLITDVYSSKIMGYSIKDHLGGEGCIEALKMALKTRKDPSKPLIHHSDRGAQYCGSDHVKILKRNKIKISMTNNGDPYENAKAERVNGILKDEFLIEGFQNHLQAVEEIKKVVFIYNGKRPHLSCDFLTPDQAYQREGYLERRWKSYYSINKKGNIHQIINS